MVRPIPKTKFSKFIWTAPGERLVEIVNTEFKNHSFFSSDNRQAQNLLMFINNEVGFIKRDTSTERPKHIDYMLRHELVDYCDVSEKGHLKWYPKGMLIQRLILEYARNVAREWGAFEMKNPLLIKEGNNLVGALMGEFHERDYKVDGGRGVGYLRYASDPLGFPFMQKVRFTKNQSPLKVYEEATCFRNEQEGEVSGLKRVRNFLMTDMHAACSNEEEARKEFEQLSHLFGKLMNNIIAKGRWILGWEGTENFFEEHKEWLKGIGDNLEVPAFFKLTPSMTHYYVIKNEYQGILADNSNLQVSTVQWDVKDGERFDIGYIGEDGKKYPCPVILHASSFGSIERTLCTILENIAIDEAEGKTPEYPLWLAPTQVRIIPVSDVYVEYALSLTNHFNVNNVRADIDDKQKTVGKKIMTSEEEWVPYMIVIGKDEIERGQLLQIRERSTKQTYPSTKEDLIEKIHAKTRGMPYLPLPLPKNTSRRPLFR